MSIIVQQDATIYSLFISVNCSTCFGCYLHPSSGAHITVSTVSGINDTVTATRREHVTCHVNRHLGLTQQNLFSSRPFVFNPLPQKWWTNMDGSQSQWLRGLRRRSAAARLLRLWVRIPPEALTSVCSQQVEITVSLMPDTVGTVI